MTEVETTRTELFSNREVNNTEREGFNDRRDSGIKPLPLVKTIIYGFVPALSLYIIHYFLIPVYVGRMGIPYFQGYLVGYGLSMTFFFVAALVAYGHENNPWRLTSLKNRFRLAKINYADWLWIIGIILFTLVTYFGLGFTGEWVKSVPFLAPRAAWPAEFGPGGVNNYTPGEFMGMELKGQWWVVLVFFIGWFFNIFGEEFWFRGYLLPRQELAFGKRAWIANGMMFTLNHIWQPWILIAILPTSLLLAYAVQSRRNTWIGIIQHGVVNISLLFILIGGVMGIP